MSVVCAIPVQVHRSDREYNLRLISMVKSPNGACQVSGIFLPLHSSYTTGEIKALGTAIAVVCTGVTTLLQYDFVRTRSSLLLSERSCLFPSSPLLLVKGCCRIKYIGRNCRVVLVGGILLKAEQEVAAGPGTKVILNFNNKVNAPVVLSTYAHRS